MHRDSVLALTLTASLALAGAAFAQTSGDNTTDATKGTTVGATTTSTEEPKPAVDLQTIRDRGMKMSERARNTAEAKFDAAAKQVDKEAASKGDNTVAERLAKEFNMTADVLIAEKDKYGVGWGELMIAHTLLANSTDLTLDQFFAMHKDGMGWGQIARGMDLNLGQAIAAIQSEGRVASGHAKPDGKVPPIHTGSTHSRAGAHTGTGAEHGHTGVTPGAGTGTMSKGHGGK